MKKQKLNIKKISITSALAAMVMALGVSISSASAYNCKPGDKECEEAKANMQKNKTEANDYIKNDECDTWEDTSNAVGNFTVIGKEFKYGIPFKTLYAVNDAVCENLKRMVSVEKHRGNHSITEETALECTINGVGLSPYLWRKETTKGLA